MKLELRPFLQSKSSTCLPTCLRIALHHFGLEQSEEQLPYGKSGAHAVVICGFEKNEVLYIDPALGREMSLDLLTFFKAWESLGRAGLVIYPKSGL